MNGLGAFSAVPLANNNVGSHVIPRPGSDTEAREDDIGNAYASDIWNSRRCRTTTVQYCSHQQFPGGGLLLVRLPRE